MRVPQLLEFLFQTGQIFGLMGRNCGHSSRLGLLLYHNCLLVLDHHLVLNLLLGCCLLLGLLELLVIHQAPLLDPMTTITTPTAPYT